MSKDLYEAPDYFLMDELLTEEHKLIRDAAREWVKRDNGWGHRGVTEEKSA